MREIETRRTVTLASRSVRDGGRIMAGSTNRRLLSLPDSTEWRHCDNWARWRRCSMVPSRRMYGQ